MPNGANFVHDQKMTEVWNNWNRSLVNYCVIYIFLLIQGFVILQCCGDATHTNTSTSIRWCRNLTTTINQDYLVRGTFLGDQQRSTSSSSVHVLIGVTPIALVNSSDEFTVEAIFKATRNYSNFCLLKEKAEVHLSELELRPISSNYLKREPSSVLKLIDRVDAGNKEVEVRYPHDQYDRIWKADSHSNPTANYTSLTTANITITNTSISLPPIEVLRTALTHPERLEFLYEDLDSGYNNYDLILYYLELNETIQARQRVFDIYINNDKRLEVDIVAGGPRYYTAVLKFTAHGFLNLTMVKTTSGSQLGPICNAYEIFQVHQWIQETTPAEVNAIISVKDELLEQNQDNEVLISWFGDPCLPTPWQRLFCDSVNNGSFITKMDLSFNRLKGPIPRSITRLVHLRELDLRQNYLEGDITELLTSLPYLEILYFGCNPHLDNKLPANLYRSNLTTDKGICHDQATSQSAKKIIIGIVIGGALLVLTATGIILICLYKRKMMAKGIFDVKGHTITKNAVYSISSMDSIILKSISVQSYTLQYIETVTQKYKTLIGEGGFGSVYRGTLLDGQEVAVKVRSATSTQGTREFENELNLLSSIQHENLVPLLGYCCENDQQILVYPFMSNGSLQDRLYGDAAKRKTLDWPTRLSIALGAARGLAYLHTFSSRCVIHRDVKSSNILLDHSMCAKVADFGFSKYAPQEGDSGTSLEVRGTAGYLDPEYYSTQHLSTKSDVFSFGVVLLEIVTGREPLNVQRPQNEWSLVEWAKARVRNSRVEEVVDPSLKGGYHAEAMWRVVEVALACTEPYSAYRPCMADIVRELEDALIIENNASEYMKSIESIYSAGGSNRFTERIVIIPSTPVQTEPSPFSQPAPPQPR